MRPRLERERIVALFAEGVKAPEECLGMGFTPWKMLEWDAVRQRLVIFRPFLERVLEPKP